MDMIGHATSNVQDVSVPNQNPNLPSLKARHSKTEMCNLEIVFLMM